MKIPKSSALNYCSYSFHSIELLTTYNPTKSDLQPFSNRYYCLLPQLELTQEP